VSLPQGRTPSWTRPARSSTRSAVLRVAASLAVLVATVLLVVGLLPEGAGVADGHRASVPDEVVAEALRFDDATLADVAAYRAPRRVAAALGLALSVVVPLAMALALRSGRARRTLRLAGALPGPALQAAAAAACVVALTALVRLPIGAWAALVQDGRWGFRTRSVPGWLLDHATVVGARALGVAALVWLVATLVARWPDDWHVRAVLLVAVIGPLALLLHPLVVHPVLLPTEPLVDGPHRDAVVAVVERSAIDVPVLVGEASLRTTRRNAVATGLGPTERIVLHDTLLELQPHEVAAIAAHELAHLERRDPLRAALAPVPAVALVALVVRRRLRASVGPPDVRALASAAALVIALEAAATPVVAGITRTIEHRTDVRSVAISGDPLAHVTMLRAFVTDGLADPDPPRWSVLLWATHPTPTERILAVTGAGDPATR
jgi:STE24 endopeptidase